MHGSNRLGGNSLSDLLVFGKRAGEHAAAYADELAARPKVAVADVEAAVETALAPLQRDTGENPYTLQHDLQAVMGDLVGIIRREGELEDVAEAAGRAAGAGGARSSAAGGRRYNPGWHLALDLRNMLVVSECTAKAALERRGVARRAHPRGLPDDGPEVAPGQPGLLAGRRRRCTLDRTSRCRRCAPSCSSSSTGPSWPST